MVSILSLPLIFLLSSYSNVYYGSFMLYLIHSIYLQYFVDVNLRSRSWWNVNNGFWMILWYPTWTKYSAKYIKRKKTKRRWLYIRKKNMKKQATCDFCISFFAWGAYRVKWAHIRTSASEITSQIEDSL